MNQPSSQGQSRYNGNPPYQPKKKFRIRAVHTCKASTLARLDEQINSRLEKGWKLDDAGLVIVQPGGILQKPFFLQRMVRWMVED